MNLSVGIVGLPNVGKSTLFNALLKRQTAFVANYPFATIEPNIGVVPVPDPRLRKLAEITKAEVKMDKLPPEVPATVKFVDIAGIVKGASEGEGLGNKFLSHIREVDVICHVVRYFTDGDVVHVAGSVEPKRDREIINSELILADLESLKRAKDKMGRDPAGQKKVQAMEKLITEMNKGILAKDVVLSDEEKAEVKDLQILTIEPMIYVANVSEGDLKKDITIDGHAVFPISAKIESELSSLSDDDQKTYLKELGMEESGLDRLIKLAYKTLGLISFLTAGEKEVRAWTIRGGMSAPEAAGVIHTDFEKGFIKADVISFDEFVSLGGWGKAREIGKVRMEGREYVMQDGDVVEFKVNA
ncbi:redox-regulated ATPase YchF [Candidatus Gottesmanbacteria bacterium RIFCSPHIGHO2_01_FULL_39_10]|uniref:Ribosome-binding ATPase YchF n=1 Tax=Candidatus Gottesmanbacteria bacterium RIFCSPHIGHO2_01_FULL_39_10 TaxID=1798375 RepID=A0A1F5ZQG9_9BACT|nr:MAG: redox-regulated ATPase YchF [Candidatus Gottesmanbacteria bacterium RIFCSPHIGHO2_01_FULL_39_10]